MEAPTVRSFTLALYAHRLGSDSRRLTPQINGEPIEGRTAEITRRSGLAARLLVVTGSYVCPRRRRPNERSMRELGTLGLMGFLTWQEELRIFLDVVRRSSPPREQVREDYSRFLERTLAEEVYPAFEEFLAEMTRHGISGQIYGRTSGYGITLRLDDGFEVAVERDRYREQSQLLPRLIFVVYDEEQGRKYFSTSGVAWDRIRKAEVLARLLEEYKRWSLKHFAPRE